MKKRLKLLKNDAIKEKLPALPWNKRQATPGQGHSQLSLQVVKRRSPKGFLLLESKYLRRFFTSFGTQNLLQLWPKGSQALS